MKIVRGNYLIFNNNLPLSEGKTEALNESATGKEKMSCDCYVIIPTHKQYVCKVSSYVRIMKRHFDKIRENWKSGIRLSSVILTGMWNNYSDTETIEEYTVDVITADTNRVNGFLKPWRVDFSVSFPTLNPDWRMLYEFTTVITKLTEMFGYSSYNEVYNKADPDNNTHITQEDLYYMSGGNVSLD